MRTGMFRRLGRRGVLITGLVTLALVVGLMVGLMVGLVVKLPGQGSSSVQARTASPSPSTSPLPSQPSPSNAMLAMTRQDMEAESTINEGVSARTGAVIWSAPTLAGTYGIEVASANGVYYAVGRVGNNANAFTAYRMSDGVKLWSVVTPNSFSDYLPLLVAHGLLLYYVGNSASNWTISALDVTTHTVTWHDTVPNGGYPGIAANDSLLFVSTLSGSPLQPELDVSAFRLRDGALVWRHQVFSQASIVAGAPRGPVRGLIAGPDSVYVTDGMGAVVALRQSNGAVIWRSQPIMNEASAIQLTYSGSTLYECATPNKGDQRPLLALDPAAGSVRWRISSQTCYGRIIELNGVVYLAEQDMVARRVSDGSVLWRVSPQSIALGFLSMQVDAGVVIAAASVIDLSRSDCSPGPENPCQYTGYLAAYNAATGAIYWQVNVDADPLLISDGRFGRNRPEFVV